MVRRDIARQFGTLKTFTYITSDDVSGRGLRNTDPLARIWYYKAPVDGRPAYFTFHMTTGGKVAMLNLARD